MVAKDKAIAPRLPAVKNKVLELLRVVRTTYHYSSDNIVADTVLLTCLFLKMTVGQLL